METTQSTLPILGIGEHGESLVGNLEGYALLREAIQRLEEKGSSHEDVKGQMEIRTLELWSSGETEAELSFPIKFACLSTITMIVVVPMGFAIFGFLQFLEDHF